MLRRFAIAGLRLTGLLLTGMALLACDQLKQLDKVPDPGTLVIRSVPTGASISVDGLPEGKTPLTLEASADQRERIRRVAVSRSGYRTWRRHVSQLASTGQVMTVYLQRSSSDVDDDAPVAQPVELEIKAPAGLKLEIDGLAIGRKTPLREYTIKPGTHQVGLRSGSKVYNYRVTVAEPGPAVLTIRKPGKPPQGNEHARLASYLGCSGCDGKPAPEAKSAARTPLPTELAELDPQPEPEPEAIPLEADERVELAINTVPTAMVKVDGVDSGRRTPMFPGRGLKLSAGKHQLVFTTNDGDSYIYNVVLRPGVVNKLLIRQLGGPATGNVDAEALGGGQ